MELGEGRCDSSLCRDVVFFFFQAEDGIRYLVRSRGLGDVYKRQGREDAEPRLFRRFVPPGVGEMGVSRALRRLVDPFLSLIHI